MLLTRTDWYETPFSVRCVLLTTAPVDGGIGYVCVYGTRWERIMVDNDMSIAKLQTIYTYFTQLIPCIRAPPPSVNLAVTSLEVRFRS